MANIYNDYYSGIGKLYVDNKAEPIGTANPENMYWKCGECGNWLDETHLVHLQPDGSFSCDPQPVENKLISWLKS